MMMVKAREKRQDSGISTLICMVTRGGGGGGHLIQVVGIQERILEKVKTKLGVKKRDKLIKSNDR